MSDHPDERPDQRPQAAPGAHTHAQPNDPLYRELNQSADFHELRKRYRAFAFPVTIAFLVWYLLYVLLSTYASDFMGKHLFGNINIGLVLGLLQFVTTFGIAWVYARHAAAKFDPIAGKINTEYESRRLS